MVTLMGETVPKKGRRRQRGFTLIELMMVVTVIGILASIALPNYRIAIQASREAVLKEDLFQLRSLIDQYYSDKGKWPASLDALVEDGYLRKIPSDPITGSADWETVAAESDSDNPNDSPGISDVKSAAAGNGMNGVAFSEW